MPPRLADFTVEVVAADAARSADAKVAVIGSESYAADGQVQVVPGPIIDTAAMLALLNPVPDVGQQIVAWDVPITAYGDGHTAWLSLPKVQRPPVEKGHSSSSTIMSGITGTVDITDLASLSFTVTDYPVWIGLRVAYLMNSHASAASTAVAHIADGANVSKRTSYVGIAAGFSSNLFTVHRVVTPGAYTFKGRIQKANGTLAMNADATTVTEFWASERAIVV